MKQFNVLSVFPHKREQMQFDAVRQSCLVVAKQSGHLCVPTFPRTAPMQLLTHPRADPWEEASRA